MDSKDNLASSGGGRKAEVDDQTKPEKKNVSEPGTVSEPEYVSEPERDSDVYQDSQANVSNNSY